jgi:hypothetical protein
LPCLAKLKQLNREDREYRKEKSLRGLYGSNPSSMAFFGARFADA